MNAFKVLPEGAYPFLNLDDSRFIKQCSVDTYTASGPGGQHRNRTYSAVRITHKETGVSAIAEESRSQLENKQKALRRIKRAVALSVRRDPLRGLPAVDERLRPVFLPESCLLLNRANPLYPVFCATILDALYASEGKIRDAAGQLGVSSGRLNKMLGKDKDLFMAANKLRVFFGLKLLGIKK